MKVKNKIGQRFGRLVVLSREGGKKEENKPIYYTCRCDCGSTVKVRDSNLGTSTKSCGCLRREKTRERRLSHGETINGTVPALYSIWRKMRNKCIVYSNANALANGTCGITVCHDWKDYAKFRDWAMTSGYQEGLHLVRKDLQLGFYPNNCAFGPQRQYVLPIGEQIYYKGKIQSLYKWSIDLGIMYTTLWRRLHKVNMSVRRAFETPVRHSTQWYKNRKQKESGK